MKGFTLLWQKILRSSIWIKESKETRLVWVTLLSLKDEEGKILCSEVGLADAAKVSREECAVALQILTSPDPDDTSGVEEGRRLRIIPGGWEVVNADLYRFSTIARREFWRDEKARQRAALGNRDSGKKQAQHSHHSKSGEVELPHGFPKTLKEALEVAQMVGCPPDVAENAWKKSDSRGGRDAKDVPIRNFRAYLAMEASYARSREAEKMAGKRPKFEQAAGSIPLKGVRFAKEADGKYYELTFEGDLNNVISRKLCDPQPSAPEHPQ